MTAQNFERGLALVLDLEGGFVEDPRDPGGATNLGITQATLARARGRAVSRGDVRALTRAEAGAIYRRLYWAAVEGDRLPAGIDLAVFDCAVNSGPARAARLLQAALGLPPDGIVGPQTLRAANAADAGSLIAAYATGRRAFLKGLSTWSAFGSGWSRRLAAVEREALALAAAHPSSPPAKGAIMTTASVLSSRSVWANLIGLASIALGLAGVQTGSIDASGLADAAASLFAAGSFIVSTIFRVMEGRKATG